MVAQFSGFLVSTRPFFFFFFGAFQWPYPDLFSSQVTVCGEIGLSSGLQMSSDIFIKGSRLTRRMNVLLITIRKGLWPFGTRIAGSCSRGPIFFQRWSLSLKISPCQAAKISSNHNSTLEWVPISFSITFIRSFKRCTRHDFWVAVNK